MSVISFWTPEADGRLAALGCQSATRPRSAAEVSVVIAQEQRRRRTRWGRGCAMCGPRPDSDQCRLCVEKLSVAPQRLAFTAFERTYLVQCHLYDPAETREQSDRFEDYCGC